MFGAVIAHGGDYREVFQHFRPGFDLEKERQARLDAGIGEFLNGHDLYPDARPCLRELNLPCDLLATSDEWGAAKPDTAFFDKLVAVSGHDRHEIAYVGDRLDNDIVPAARAGLFTIWVRRGPWGYVLRPRNPLLAGKLPEDAPSLTVATLSDLVTELNADRIAGPGQIGRGSRLPA